jgi:hypothetical protein
MVHSHLTGPLSCAITQFPTNARKQRDPNP